MISWCLSFIINTQVVVGIQLAVVVSESHPVEVVVGEGHWDAKRRAVAVVVVVAAAVAAFPREVD